MNGTEAPRRRLQPVSVMTLAAAASVAFGGQAAGEPIAYARLKSTPVPYLSVLGSRLAPAAEPQTAPGPAPVPIEPALTPPVVAQTPGQPPASPNQPTLPTIRPLARDITIVIPLKDGETYLGDVDVTIAASGGVSISRAQFLLAVQKALSVRRFAQLEAALSAQETVTPEQIADAGQPIIYDPAALEIRLAVAAEQRERRELSVADLDRETTGTFADPARLTAYLNLRGSLDYVHEGASSGDVDPIILLDSAVRYSGFVLENEFTYDTGAIDGEFTRDRTRLVHDDVTRVLRWSAGDLRPQTRGFQGGLDIGGIAIERLYSDLQPQRNVRPRGQRSFTLQRAATVETIINGRTVQRIRLQPGSYDVRDFPFVDGSNDVSIVIDDGTGMGERLDFSLFFDRDQLSEGLSEFGFYAGVESDIVDSQIDYGGEAAFSGFYRRGISENLTAGANAQVLGRTRLLGLEGLWGSPIGNVGADVSFSSNDLIGETGYAVNVGVQRLVQNEGEDAQTFSAVINYRSEFFTSVGELSAANPYSVEAVASYSRNFGEYIFAGFDARYAVGRYIEPDTGSFRASLGYRLNEATNVVFDTQYDFGGREEGVSFRIGLTRRFGQTGSGRLDYDSRTRSVRTGYQESRGRGIGATSVNADLEYLEDAVALNGSYNYTANRADLGVSHNTSYDIDGSEIRDQRTSIRGGASIAFADGQFAVGRPIYDSFVLFRPHGSLRGAEIIVDPSPDGDLARSGTLGPALLSELSSYSTRTTTYDVPTAPTGYDIGAGSLRVLPPYRAGYLVTVGSDSNVLAIGRLINREGAPLALVVGRAIEVGGEGEPITIFTSRDGRFSAQGLRPGRWRLEMPGSPPLSYELIVPDSGETLLRTGDLRPISESVDQ